MTEKRRSVLTYRYRLRRASGLSKLARTVNLVWNYCGDVQEMARKHNYRWPSRFDYHRLLKGASAEVGLPVSALRGISDRFVQARAAAHHRPRWRRSGGARRSLGWVPFYDGGTARLRGDTVTFYGHEWRVWLHRPVSGRVLCGSFAEDARGRWYLNLTCDVEADQRCGVGKNVFPLQP